MKTRMFTLLVCLLVGVTSGFAKSRDVRGNGHVVKKQIEVQAYDEVQLVGSVDFEYQQSTAAPHLIIEVDENILPLVVAKVEGRILKVYLKHADESPNGAQGSNTVNPTVFKIKSNSRELKDVEVIGSANFSVTSPLSVAGWIEVSIAGSGSVDFEKALSGTKAEFSLSGSGEIHAKQIEIDNLVCSVAGSGEINLKGNVPRASYSVAGSGEINAFDCRVKALECSVAGSGNIEAYATDKLDASVVSSGEITYKGAPATLNKSTLGSGSIRAVSR